ncbi:fatty acyl-AMP ligase [Streptomyces sp. MB09-02B]|uniref:fatty acyl-AMP ligase n=1 Tax=Streptomyces sp. MB09-02B TaxID=3028667 RepID=UPI0029ADAD0E|nr:fatty acyl-AMP ligase [Streptomyces sp. MB09-02B]MDX3638440.1 fatty acyl-AMP ligase [Streptomyces sp. MB09-02B]
MTAWLQHEPTAVHLLRRYADERGSGEAVRFIHDHDAAEGWAALSFGQLDAEARRIASWLQDRGATGDRVMLLHPPGLSFVTAFLGCVYAGAIAVPAPMPGQFQHQRRRATGMAHNAGAGIALTDTRQLADADRWIGGQETRVRAWASDTPDFGDAGAWREPDVTGDDAVLLQYTSGSTGNPKGVVVRHQHLLHNAASLGRSLGLDEHTRFGGWVPLYHDMGLMGQLLPGLFLGGGAVLMSPMAFLKRPYHWLATIDRHDVNYSAAPDFAYGMCVRKVTDSQLASLDLSRWRCAVNGSEPIQAATLRAFAERFASAGFRPESLAPSYGMAEATVFVSGRTGRSPVITTVDAAALEKHEVQPVADSGSPTRDLVGCGDAADFDVLIVEPDSGRPLEDRGVGEIWLRGSSVTGEYWESPDATAVTFEARTTDGDGPYLRTGDMGAVVDGELYVTGRIKELLIVHGRNLYPQDLEHELRLQHPELSNLAGAAFGVHAPEENVVVVHEIRGNFDEPRLRGLTSLMRATISREFGVRVAGIVLVRPGTVQKTTSGKVQRSLMRQLFLANELTPLVADLDPALREATVWNAP